MILRMAVLFECKAAILFYKLKDMIRKKRKLSIYRQQKIKNDCTCQGVLQGRTKLRCGTPFLLVRNLSDFRCYCCFAYTSLWEKFDCFCFFFGQEFGNGLLFH